MLHHFDQVPFLFRLLRDRRRFREKSPFPLLRRYGCCRYLFLLEGVPEERDYCLHPECFSLPLRSSYYFVPPHRYLLLF